MADGRHRAIADLTEGDEIYGTESVGTTAATSRLTVLAHWSTVKPVFRVTLADGTELVASGDHRFLTDVAGSTSPVPNREDSGDHTSPIGSR